MKVFNFSCSHGHRFEGWFSSTEDYDRQRDQNLLSCPICDSAEVERLPSAPRLNFGAQRPAGVNSGEGVEAGGQDIRPSPPGRDQGARLKALRDAVTSLLANTEDVGERFAEEARRIHYRETRDRAIRGVASESERVELEEEGISVLRIPSAPLLKGSLQ